MTHVFSISNILRIPDWKPAAKNIPFGLGLTHRHLSLAGYENSYVCYNLSVSHNLIVKSYDKVNILLAKG